MVLDQELDGLLISSIGHQESRRLGNEEHADQDDEAGECLKDERDSPAVGVWDVECTIGDRGSRYRSTVPSTVVDAYSTQRGDQHQEFSLPVQRPLQWGGAISVV